jgi:hypothetical protein
MHVHQLCHTSMYISSILIYSYYIYIIKKNIWSCWNISFQRIQYNIFKLQMQIVLWYQEIFYTITIAKMQYSLRITIPVEKGRQVRGFVKISCVSIRTHDYERCGTLHNLSWLHSIKASVRFSHIHCSREFFYFPDLKKKTN